MADTKTYSVDLISGHRITRRALAFLICKGDGSINAKSVFEKLKPKREREVRTRFDYWLEGKINDKWFHGWPNDLRYKDCFVFKWKENRQNHRLYGFLCNPLLDYPSFQLCVLVSHDAKNAWETKPGELDGVNEIRKEAKVKEAVRKTVIGVTPR